MPNNEGKGNGKKGKGKKAVEILGKLRFPGDEHWQKLQLRLFANQVETLKKELADAEANPDSDYVDSARLREELVFVERKRTAIQEGNIILHVFQEEREDNIILRELQKENIMLGVNPASSFQAGAAHQAESARRSRSRRSRSPAWRRSSSPSSAQSEKARDEAIAEKMIAEAAAAEKIAAPLVTAPKVRRCHYDMAAANQTWKPRPALTQPFSDRAIQRNLPVRFALTHAAHDCKRALLEIIRRYPRRHVYVGTTVDPIRRWLGDTREDFERYRKEHPKKKLQPLHKGHGQSRYRGKAPPFTEMHVLAFAPLQKAVMLEPYLIRTAMDHCDGWCVNVAIDARGMTAEPNFLYVVINDIDCQSRLAHPDPSE